jgi:phosphatidate cytidylyltransferase
MANDDIEGDDDEEGRTTPPRAPGERVRIIGAQEAAKREAEMHSGRLPDDAPRFGDVPPQPSGPRPQMRFPLPEGPSGPLSGGAGPSATDLPHWSEPPTGEVPRILPASDDHPEDDLEAWSALRRQPRWREGSDWEEADFAEDDELLNDGGMPVGGVDHSRRPDLTFSDEDEEFDEPEPAPVRAREAMTRVSTRPTAEPFDYTDRRNGGDRDLPIAIAAGAALFAIAVFCFWQGPAWSAAISTVVVLLAAVEAFDAFRRAGFRPATLLGLVTTAALMIGAYTKGERAIPLILALAMVFTMLWYLIGVVQARATRNIAVTMLGVVWVGFLGSFASLMLRYPHREGVAFLLGTVFAVVANDIGALFAGRYFGNTPLAPDVSPHKTVEGWFGGLLATVFVCLVVVRGVHPWDWKSALLLAVVVSIIAPVGDLCESLIKRDLNLKDMGNILPGHGGVLDRFDAMLFALPAVYYLIELLKLPT